MAHCDQTIFAVLDIFILIFMIQSSHYQIKYHNKNQSNIFNQSESGCVIVAGIFIFIRFFIFSVIILSDLIPFSFFLIELSVILLGNSSNYKFLSHDKHLNGTRLSAPVF